MHNKKRCVREDMFDLSLDHTSRDRSEWASMYIDDLSIGETLDLDIAVSTYSQQLEKKTIHARKCEEYFETIDVNARSIGMKINSEKTQLLCINDNNICDTECFTQVDPDTRIMSTDSMKILGFVFSNKPNVTAHIEYIINKFNKAVWSINHIKRAGIKNDVIVTVYCTMLRPIIECNSPVYHPMLSQEDSKRLERLQKTALKLIFGFNKTYTELLDCAKIQSLEKRREAAFVKFAHNLSTSERFSKWFPLTSETNINLRSKKKFKEEFARTDRLFNSPLFSMRRELNRHLE